VDLIKPLAQHIFIPLSYYREGFDIVPQVRALEKSQYFSADERHDQQWRRLSRILKLAYDDVPYYGELFRNIGLKPEDIRTDDDLRQIPVLTKQNIRDNQDKLISTKYHRSDMFSKTTGGSTGVPLQLYWSIPATTAKKSATVRHDAWTGYRLGEKLAMVWGTESYEEGLRFHVYNFLVMRHTPLNTLDMSGEKTLTFLDQIRRRKIRYLFGHATSVYILALFARDQNITNLPIESILTTAEVLTDEARTVIEEVFGAPVFDRYGCEELSVIASECEAHDGLHVNAENLYLEIEGGNDQEPGEIIITDLVNDGMPLIRYRTEDMSMLMPGSCSCGRTLPRLKKVYGRHTDFLYTPEGRMISGVSIMTNLAINIPGIWQVQVIQDKIDHLLFRIVRTDKFGEDGLRKLAEMAPGFFGPRMTYDVEFVEALERTPRGKYQFSICKIERPGGQS
jgi:phenylacetate-CoA ligase